MNIKIENVIVSKNLGTEIDTDALAKKLPDAEYNPAKFPGLIFKLKKPNVIVLLFKSGKLVATNARSVDEAKTALESVINDLRAKAKLDMNPEADVTVHNMVASYNVGGSINLEDAKALLEVDGEVEYNPEEFPAVIFKDVPRAMAVMIFDNGKLVVTGARREEEIGTVLQGVVEILTESGLVEAS